MIAHCPKCGKFLRIDMVTYDFFDHGHWLWRKTYSIEVWRYMCSCCNHSDYKIKVERLR